MKPWLTPQELARPLTASDDLPHVPGSEPGWREHWWIGFFDHASGVHGKVWTGVLPNLDQGFAFCAIFHRQRPLLYLYESPVPMTDHFGEGAPPVSFRCLDPFRSWKIEVRTEVAIVDLEWQAVGPVYDWRWGEIARSRRLEQPGRVRGTAVCLGERVEIDGMAQRDRSWGVRRKGVDVVEALATWTLFSENDVQAAAALRTRQGDDLLFGYRIREGDAQTLDALEIERSRAYRGGPPLSAHLVGYGGGTPILDASTTLMTVLDQDTKVQHADGRRIEVRMSRQHCLWAQEGRTCMGHLDYNESAAPELHGSLAVEGNDGAWVESA